MPSDCYNIGIDFAIMTDIDFGIIWHFIFIDCFENTANKLYYMFFLKVN